MEIVDILRKIRRDNNLSQQNVADELGVDVSTYARIENGDTQLKFEHAVKLSELYKITLDQLYNYDKLENMVHDPLEVYKREMKRVDVMVRLDGSENTLDTWVKKLTAINQIL